MPEWLVPLNLIPVGLLNARAHAEGAQGTQTGHTKDAGRVGYPTQIYLEIRRSDRFAGDLKFLIRRDHQNFHR